MNMQVHLRILRPRFLSLPLGLQVLGPIPSLPHYLQAQPFSSSPPTTSPTSPLPSSPSSFGEDDIMLTSLHSFVSSLSLPPLASSTALEQHQQLREKTPISIWILQIESNYRRMVDIDHIAK
ncbi:hypothetical protein AAC387_Pa05g3530 [Persea americana]